MFRAVLFAFLLLASTRPGLADTSNQDPFESFNRKSFAVHQFLDTYFARPIALTYRTVVPSPARTGVANFFRNISEPVTMANALRSRAGASLSTRPLAFSA
jgi:phospholipid-binding lipoprotein MlaA